MSKVTPMQVNFNGGELSERMHGRVDHAIYDIGGAKMSGVIPLVEGGLEFAPGTIWVEQSAGACRLIPFEYSATQGHVLEVSASKIRIYTNDARIESAPGVPVEVAVPYLAGELDRINWEQSFDVTYLFHGNHPVQQLVRTGADSFVLEEYVPENGPYEPRNKDKTISVSADASTGTGITLTATEDLFEAGDVGGLFQLEVLDFGDVPLWQPGITTSAGEYLQWNEKVYVVAGGPVVDGNMRTGNTAPEHDEGVEWDGIGAGTDVADNAAGGVQLEYVHDRFGQVKITAYTDARHVTGDVQRQIPTSITVSYDYTDVFGNDYTGWTPPTGAGSYTAGTWRWYFGAFSPRRGYPTGGKLRDGRLVLFKGSRPYGSVVEDFADHSKFNELGEISTDQAFVQTMADANEILHMVETDNMLILNATGLHSLSANNAAQNEGAGNIRIDPKNSSGAAFARPVIIDGRVLYVSKSRRKILQAEYEAGRNVQLPVDLTRYSRHIGLGRFKEIVSQREADRLIWSVSMNGALHCATYVPEEQVLGWVRRPMPEGMMVRSICVISDPAGEMDQLWLAVEYGGSWHILRMAQIRQDGENDVNAVMTDMAGQYDGSAVSDFVIPHLAGEKVDIIADGRVYLAKALDAGGAITLPVPASKFVAGLRFEAKFDSLPIEAGGDSGPAVGKMKRIGQILFRVLNTRGLEFSVQNGDWKPMKDMDTHTEMDAGFDPFTGLLFDEVTGDHERLSDIRVRRIAPTQATLLAVQPTVDVAQS